MNVDAEHLGAFLVDAGVVTRAQLSAARAEARRSGVELSHTLLATGVLGEDELRRASAAAFGVPFVTLSRDEVSRSALTCIPEPFCRTHQLVAFRQDGDTIEVAFSNLASMEELYNLEPKLPYRVLPRLADRSSIRSALVLYQQHLKQLFGDALAAERQAAPERLTDLLLQHALTSRATHVHVDTSEATVLVRYRIGGALHEAMRLPASAGPAIEERLATLAGLTDTTTEGRFKIALNGGSDHGVAVRVSRLPTSTATPTTAQHLTLHLVPTVSGRRGFTLESLGLHGQALEDVRQLSLLRSGLVLVCGQGESGKTTLLYTLLDQLGGTDRAVASIESSIESHLPSVRQVRIEPERGISAAGALRALLRQDTEVIMLADITDKETAVLAIAAANRGALVLAGISTSSAVAGIEALRAFGVAPTILSGALRAVIATQLVRRLCPQHESRRLSRAEADVLEIHAQFGRVLSALKDEQVIGQGAQWRDVTFSRPEPCAQCRGGYQGRVGLHEVVPMTLALRDQLARGASSDELRALAREEGSLSIVEDGLCKAANGETSIEEVLRVAGV